MTSAPLLSSAPKAVLVASPSPSLREQVRESLGDRCWPVQEALGGADALLKLESGPWQLLFLDRRLPDLDVEELIPIIERRFPGTEVVLMDSETGLGAASVPPRPAGAHSWLRPLARVSPVPAAEKESPGLRLEPPANRNRIPPLPGMIGDSAAMQPLYRLTRLVAPRTTTVLVMGATGTGKELVARAVHQLSPRAAKPWVVVNCAAIPETLLEAELFGYVRGAFTGALQTYVGRIQLAQGGTLFLDEIGELPFSLQAKLLRFLEQKEMQRLGSAETLKVDVRVVAASNKNLAGGAEAGDFREDLYYRLSGFPLELPPLAARRDDILPLAEHFLRLLVPAAPVAAPKLTAAAAARLEAHGWSGNVRELQQVIERAAILADGGSHILPAHLAFAPNRLAEASAEPAEA